MVGPAGIAEPRRVNQLGCQTLRLAQRRDRSKVLANVKRRCAARWGGAGALPLMPTDALSERDGQSALKVRQVCLGASNQPQRRR